MTNYKAWKMPGIGEKPIWVIVDEIGKTIRLKFRGSFQGEYIDTFKIIPDNTISIRR